MLSRSKPKPRVPAIVLGGGVTALGVTRSLARERIEVFNLSNDHDFADSSRWWRPLGASTDKFPTARELASLLQPLPFDRAVLFPCSDAWLRAVTGLDPALGARFVSTATFDRYDLLTDKGGFAAAVAAAGVPAPRTVALDCRADLERLSDDELRGMFLKPRGSQRFASRFGQKGFEVANRSDALECFARADHAGFAMILQEWIPGPPARHYFIDGFVDRHGRTRAMFGRRRVRMHPPTLGNSTCTVSIALNEMAPAVASMERLIRRLRLRGIFSAEFKFDDRDGVWKIIEINARPWWYVGFATNCGVNVSTMAYRDVLDLPLDDVRDYTVGARCIYLNEDWHSCRRLHAAGQLTIREWVTSWLRSEYLVLRWDDPMPGLRHISRSAIESVRRHAPVGRLHVASMARPAKVQ
jgi:D-aspartate ligase